MANRRFVQRAVRRPTIWLVASDLQTVTTGASVTSAIISAVSAETFPVPTLVRIRGEITVAIASSAATPGRVNVFCGIAVVSQAALAGAAVSLPFTDGSRDWIWWSVFPLKITSGNITTPTGEEPFNLTTRKTIDSKSMRKIPGDSALVFVTENVVVTSTQTVDVQYGVRMLLKR